MTPVLGARQLSKAYGGSPLFADVALTIGATDRVGLLGMNGAGKSTLLRVLAGREPADGGVVDRRKGARVLYLAQEPELDLEATPEQIVLSGLADLHAATARHAAITREIEAGARDPALLEEQARVAEAIERLGGWSRDHVALAMLEKLGVRDVARPVGTMSGGERRRVALARLLVAEPDLAILDEPTNHLDTETIVWLEEHLATSFPGAVLLVTHDRYVLDVVCDRIVELERGALTEYEGGYGDYLEQKQTRLEHEERVEQNRLNLLRRERAWLLRGAKARTTKQKARIQRAEALMSETGPTEAQRVALAGLEQGAQRTGRTILELHDLRLDLGGRTLVDDLTLHLTSGERLGIVGPNGAGKTTLLKAVTGELSPASGEVRVGKQTRIVLFDQAREQLEDGWSVFDNVAGREGAERTGGGVVTFGERTIELRAYLEQFLFDGAKQRQKVGALSGGERARVALAKTLRTGANLLLLDEPTNDLDIATLGALEELLVGWPGCVLVVSHDRWFLNRVATGILAFEGDGRVVRYAGGWDAWWSAREAARDAARAAAVTAASAASGATGSRGAAATAAAAPAAAAAKPLTYAERLELDGIVDRIAAAEAVVASLETQLADPSTYGDGEKIKTVRADLARAHEDVVRLTARWEELESRPRQR